MCNLCSQRRRRSPLAARSSSQNPSVIPVAETQLEAYTGLETVGSPGAPAPILELPAEILCRIFRLCVPEDKFKQPSVISPPLVFCHVCRYWRDAAWNEPALWTRPRILFASSPGSQRKSSLMRKTLEVYVDRSQNATFDLSISEYLPAMRSTQGRESWKEDFRLVRSTVPRCRELCLLAQSEDWFGLLNPVDANQFASLQFIFLRILPRLSALTPLDFSSAPLLRHGRFFVVNPTSLPRIKLPYGQMQSLDCGIGSTEENGTRYPNHGFNVWRDLVSKCVNLVDITVYFHGRGYIDCFSLSSYDSHYAPPRDQVTFNFAKSLSIHAGFSAALTTVVRGMKFPSLDKLHCISTGHSVSLVDHTTPLPEALQTTLSFFPGLTNLRLLRVDIGDTDLLDVFRSTPLLTSVDIMLGKYDRHQFIPNDVAAVDHLTLDENQTFSPILPRLRDLRLYYCEEEAYTAAENVARYACLAISRFQWAQSQTETRDEGVPISKIRQDLPTYPFRLFMKFNVDSFYSQSEPIRRAIPEAKYPIFWPETSRSFNKEV